MSNNTKFHWVDVVDDSGKKISIELDHNGHMYIDGKRLVTDLELKTKEKVLAWIIGISSAVIAIMSVVSYFFPR